MVRRKTLPLLPLLPYTTMCVDLETVVSSSSIIMPPRRRSSEEKALLDVAWKAAMDPPSKKEKKGSKVVNTEEVAVMQPEEAPKKKVSRAKKEKSSKGTEMEQTSPVTESEAVVAEEAVSTEPSEPSGEPSSTTEALAAEAEPAAPLTRQERLQNLVLLLRQGQCEEVLQEVASLRAPPAEGEESLTPTQQLDLYNVSSVALLRLERYEECIQVCTSALAMAPQMLLPMQNRLTSYLRMNVSPFLLMQEMDTILDHGQRGPAAWNLAIETSRVLMMRFAMLPPVRRWLLRMFDQYVRELEEVTGDLYAGHLPLLEIIAVRFGSDDRRALVYLLGLARFLQNNLVSRSVLSQKDRLRDVLLRIPEVGAAAELVGWVDASLVRKGQVPGVREKAWSQLVPAVLQHVQRWAMLGCFGEASLREGGNQTRLHLEELGRLAEKLYPSSRGPSRPARPWSVRHAPFRVGVLVDSTTSGGLRWLQTWRASEAGQEGVECKLYLLDDKAVQMPGGEELLATAQSVESLTERTLEESMEVLRSADLDVLVFPQLSPRRWVPFALSQARLANYQVAWGPWANYRPRNIDAWVGRDDTQPLGRISLWQAVPEADSTLFASRMTYTSAEDVQIPLQTPVIGFPHRPDKISTKTLRVLKEALIRDSRVCVQFSEHPSVGAMGQLRTRLQTVLGPVLSSRVSFVRWYEDTEQYLLWLRRCHLVLDCSPWEGHRVANEAMSVGTSVVTFADCGTVAGMLTPYSMGSQVARDEKHAVEIILQVLSSNVYRELFSSTMAEARKELRGAHEFGQALQEQYMSHHFPQGTEDDESETEEGSAVAVSDPEAAETTDEEASVVAGEVVAASVVAGEVGDVSAADTASSSSVNQVVSEESPVL